jgi:phage baseplate assembly protein V
MSKIMAPVKRGLRLAASRVTVLLADDAQGVQTAQVTGLDGEVRDGVEVFRQYGFTSVPAGKVEGVVVCMNGSRDHAILLGTEDRKHRLRGLGAGDVAVYHAEGHHIILKAGGQIEIHGTKLTIHCPVEIPEHELTVQDIAFTPHKHGGVQTGGGQTGGPVA